MKIITNDYGCGTSSAFLDYGLKDVVVCSEQNQDHIFNLQGEPLFFVGHEFLMYLWDTERKRNHWRNYPHQKIIWCFEKIDCVVPVYQEKSHYSLSQCQTFTDSFLASDEQDCRKYGVTWFPQWSSNRFHQQRSQQPAESRVVFTGQSGFWGYEKRDALLERLRKHEDVCYVSNRTREFSWDDYIHNFLNHSKILAPFGNLKAFNTRTFEAVTSGRLLLQQVDEEYNWHVKLLEDCKTVKFFTSYEELIELLHSKEVAEFAPSSDEATKMFDKHNVYARFKSVGLEVQ